MTTGPYQHSATPSVCGITSRVESLLNWQHVVSGSGILDTPPPEGPSNTLISIEQTQAKKLTALLEALATQVPAPSTKTEAVRGDMRAHLEKAQEIARELQAPHAAPVAPAASTTLGLVTIDRTTLQRPDVELDAMKMQPLAPHPQLGGRGL